MNRVEGNRDAQTPFMMGGDAEADEKPIHPVRLSTFYMGEFLVTQGLWKAVMGENPAYFQHSDQHPVEHISWLDITETFLPQLNTLLAEPRKTYGGGAFQLPTEAQWEYAARGGRDAVPNLAYAGSEYLHEVGWFDENRGRRGDPGRGEREDRCQSQGSHAERIVVEDHEAGSPSRTRPEMGVPPRIQAMLPASQTLERHAAVLAVPP